VKLTEKREDILDRSKATASVFTFERVFGFKNTVQTEGSRYLGDFSLENKGGKTSALYVSSFRSLANFKDESFALFAAPTDPALAKDKTQVEVSDNITRSFFAFAVAPPTEGAPRKLMTASFYGDSLSIFTVDDDLTIRDEQQLH
jgi:hypothetical protein